MANNHSVLVDQVLLALGSRRDVRVWKNITGVFKNMHGDGLTRVGIVGSCDISGITASGKRLECEVKSGAGRLTKEQMLWRDMIVKFNGIWILARSVEQALSDFEKLS
jgi:hypothetical protein